MPKVDKNWKLLGVKKVKPKGKMPAWLIAVLANRGIKEKQEIDLFLEPRYEDLLKSSFFQNLDKAVKRISLAIEKNEKIVIYGDYDVDGITATALIYEVLSKLGVQKLKTYIPHREEEGYGLNKEALRELIKDEAKLIIAVDCGINSKEIIDDKEFSGLDFVVVDHHEVENDKLPSRSINLHPSMLNRLNLSEIEQSYIKKSLNLSACGLAFFLACGLQQKFPNEFPFGQEKWLLDLVALSTICDVVPLVGQNRILAKFGLLVLGKTKRQGLVELANTASLKLAEVNSYAVGFLLGPRLNAAGRLEHAQKALELLTTKDSEKAKKIAEQLSFLNRERQKMCEKILAEAKAEIEKGPSKDHEIYLLSNKNWPRGVVGIIAGRLSESYSRPVIVFEHDGETHHGSARSIDGFDITEALGEVSEYILKYGGHAKAAGLSVDDSKFIIFKEKILEVARNKLKNKSFSKEVLIDTEINLSDINDEMLELISKLEPFGYGNHTPTFLLKNIEVGNIKKVGEAKEHLKFGVNCQVSGAKEKSSHQLPITSQLNAIWFNYEKELKENHKYDIVFTLRYNVWNERKSIELRIIDVK